MKRTLSLVAIMLLGLSADAARAQSPDGIKSVDDAWVAAAQKGDVEAIVALYAPEAVYYPPDVFEARGKDAIRKVYAAWFAAVTITQAKIDSTYTTSGDLSLGHGTATVTMQPTGGRRTADHDGACDRSGEEGRRQVDVCRGPRVCSAPGAAFAQVIVSAARPPD